MKEKDSGLKKLSMTSIQSSKQNQSLSDKNNPSLVKKKDTVNIQISAPKPEPKAKNESRIKSGDYRAWDKLNIDDELEKMDKVIPVSAPARITPLHEPFTESDLPPLAERPFLAQNENIKGKECFSDQEFDQAVYIPNIS